MHVQQPLLLACQVMVLQLHSLQLRLQSGAREDSDEFCACNAHMNMYTNWLHKGAWKLTHNTHTIQFFCNKISTVYLSKLIHELVLQSDGLPERVSCVCSPPSEVFLHAGWSAVPALLQVSTVGRTQQTYCVDLCGRFLSHQHCWRASFVLRLDWPKLSLLGDLTLLRFSHMSSNRSSSVIPFNCFATRILQKSKYCNLYLRQINKHYFDLIWYFIY